MSGVLRVTIETAEEKFAPPEREVDISVVEGKLFITVYRGSLDDLQEGREKEYAVPILELSDVLHAVQAFNPSSSGVIIR